MTLNAVIHRIRQLRHSGWRQTYRLMSIKYCLPVPVFHVWPKLTHPAAQLSAIAELLVTCKVGNPIGGSVSPGVFQRILRVCGCLRFVKSAKVSHPRSYIDCKKTLGIVRRTWQAAVHAELDDAPPIRLCFTWRLCVRPSVCLLATSRKNYWSNLRKNFIIDIFGQRRPTKYWKSSGSRVHPDSRIRTEFVLAEVCGLRVLFVNAMTVQFINVIVGWRRGTADSPHS